MVPNTLQASVCDEQLMSIGGEIALSGNNKKKRKKKKGKKKRRKKRKEKMGKKRKNKKKKKQEKKERKKKAKEKEKEEKKATTLFRSRTPAYTHKATPTRKIETFMSCSKTLKYRRFIGQKLRHTHRAYSQHLWYDNLDFLLRDKK